MNDKINHPKHYKGKGLECIQVIEAFSLSFHLGNAIKYILRAGKKESKLEDLQKAIWYLEREMYLTEEEIAEDNLFNEQYPEQPKFSQKPS